MAELLGAISGIVGIAGLAVQIVDNTKKLREFCSKLKHANAHMEDLLDELDLLATLIAQFSHVEGPDLLSVPSDIQTPTKCCQKAARIICRYWTASAKARPQVIGVSYGQV